MVLHRVYWTKQKTQKKKKWEDGFMSVSANGGIKLLSEDKKQVLDTDFKTRCDEIAVDDVIEFTHYLVEILELHVDGGSQQQQQQQQDGAWQGHQHQQQHFGAAAQGRGIMPASGRVLTGLAGAPPGMRAMARPGQAPSASVGPPRSVAGKNLLRRAAKPLHPSAIVTSDGGAPSNRALYGRTSPGGHLAGGNRPQGHEGRWESHDVSPRGGADGDASTLGDRKFGPDYFKQIRRNKLFGGGDDYAQQEGGISGRQNSSGSAHAMHHHEDVSLNGSRASNDHGTILNSHQRAIGTTQAPAKPRQANDVLALLGLGGEEDEDGMGGVETLSHGRDDQDWETPWHGLEVSATAAAQAPLGTSFDSHCRPDDASAISFPSRVPIRINDGSRQQPQGTTSSRGHDAHLASTCRMVYSAVYARKSQKTGRFANGFVVLDGRGRLTLQTDEKKVIESFQVAPDAVIQDSEIEMAHHIVLVETPIQDSLCLDDANDHTARPPSLGLDEASLTPGGGGRGMQGRSGLGSEVATPTTAVKQREQESSLFYDTVEGPSRQGSKQGGYSALQNNCSVQPAQHHTHHQQTWHAGGRSAQASLPAGMRSGRPGSLFNSPKQVGAGGTLSGHAASTRPTSQWSGKQNPTMAGDGVDAAVASRGPGLGRGVPIRSTGAVRTTGCVRSGISLPNVAQLSEKPTKRVSDIKDRFQSFADYQGSFVAALEEEVTLMLRDTSLALFRAYQDLSGTASVNCKCNVGAAVKTSNKDNANKGRSFFTCRSKKCSFFKWVEGAAPSQAGAPQVWSSNLSLDTTKPPPDLKLVRQQSRVQVFKAELRSRQPRHLNRQRGEEGASGSLDNKASFIVRPLDMDERRMAGTAKQDIWVMSSSPYFSEDSRAHTAVCRSVWFGMGSDGCIELMRLSGANMSSFRDGGTAYILRGPNMTGEWDMIENLKNMAPPSIPLLPLLVSGASTQQSTSLGLQPDNSLRLDFGGIDVVAEAEKFISKFKLNSDQASIMQRFARLLMHPEDEQPVILIHGVFGSGKSTLLVAMILFFASLMKKIGGDDSEKPRMLVSSATNVAIDNILLGLMERGFEDFVRIGCLKRIAKPILKYTLRENSKDDDKIEKDSLKELNEIIKTTRDARELFQIRAAIAECKAGKLKDLRRTLGKKRVVGVTCASSGRDALVGQRFDICILDESSQFIEPLSLLPVSRFQCRILIAAGDPMQLPPTLQTPSNAEAFSAEPGNAGDLSKTLFSRLTNCGIEPTMLRTQYRCHPTIGSAASDLFYSGCLINGSTQDARSALIKGIPPLLFVDTDGSRESMQENGSFVNSEEARFCSWLVASVISKGLDSSQIGVICAYKAQVDAIQTALEGAETQARCSLSGVQVSTVDAFQGGEKDIIVVSSCRTESLGFLKSHNRMNVAITRARRHLILVGCGRTLPTHGMWKELIDRAKQQPSNNGYVGARDLQMRGELQLEDDQENQISAEDKMSLDDGDDEDFVDDTAVSGGKASLQNGEDKEVDIGEKDRGGLREGSSMRKRKRAEKVGHEIEKALDSCSVDSGDDQEHGLFSLQAFPERISDVSDDGSEMEGGDGCPPTLARSSLSKDTSPLACPPTLVTSGEGQELAQNKVVQEGMQRQDSEAHSADEMDVDLHANRRRVFDLESSPEPEDDEPVERPSNTNDLATTHTAAQDGEAHGQAGSFIASMPGSADKHFSCTSQTDEVRPVSSCTSQTEARSQSLVRSQGSGVSKVKIPSFSLDDSDSD